MPAIANKENREDFLFLVRDPKVGKFNHILQIDIVALADGNVLHIIHLGTGFKPRIFARDGCKNSMEDGLETLG